MALPRFEWINYNSRRPPKAKRELALCLPAGGLILHTNVKQYITAAFVRDF